jgi:hypothetical protein
MRRWARDMADAYAALHPTRLVAADAANEHHTEVA